MRFCRELRRTASLSLALNLFAGACGDSDEPSREAQVKPDPPDSEADAGAPASHRNDAEAAAGSDDPGIETVAMFEGSDGPRPLLLFEDGSACTDMDFVLQALSPGEHRKANPKRWTEWRRGKSGIERKVLSEWIPLEYADTFPPLSARDTVLANFAEVTSDGVAGERASAFLVTERRYQLFDDHTFVSCEYKKFSIAGDRDLEATDHEGTFEVDGYVLTLRFSEGGAETHSFVYAFGAPSIVFFDGDSWQTDYLNATSLSDYRESENTLCDPEL